MDSSTEKEISCNGVSEEKESRNLENENIECSSVSLLDWRDICLSLIHI